MKRATVARDVAVGLVIGAVASMAWNGACHAQTTIGLHLVSVHVPKRDYQHNFNPGIYVITEDGLTLGAYRNTLDRMSFYAGLTAERGPFALTLGVTTGYQKRMVPVACADPANDKGNGCLSQRGSTNGVLQPFLTPSVRLPALAGLTPRLSYIPGFGVNASVLHLSIERDF